MDWTLEDNMVDGLFFCATLTGRRGDHNTFVQAGAETPTPLRGQVMPTNSDVMTNGTLCNNLRLATSNTSPIFHLRHLQTEARRLTFRL